MVALVAVGVRGSVAAVGTGLGRRGNVLFSQLVVGLAAASAASAASAAATDPPVLLRILRLVGFEESPQLFHLTGLERLAQCVATDGAGRRPIWVHIDQEAVEQLRGDVVPAGAAAAAFGWLLVPGFELAAL